MPMCPKCKKEIEYLVLMVDLICLLERDGEIHYEPDDINHNVDLAEEFKCPECTETIFTRKFEADDFLKSPCEGIKVFSFGRKSPNFSFSLFQ